MRHLVTVFLLLFVPRISPADMKTVYRISDRRIITGHAVDCREGIVSIDTGSGRIVKIPQSNLLEKVDIGDCASAARTNESYEPGIDRAMVRDILESSFTQKRNPCDINILKREIQLITAKVRSTPDSHPDKPQILKNLGDAYKDLFYSIDVLVRRLDKKIKDAERAGKSDMAKKMRAQQIALDKKATAVNEAAIKAYVHIRDKFQGYHAYDEILFIIGYEVDRLAIKTNDEKTKSAYHSRARVFYQQLIRNYPKSKYIPHAWMAYGDYLFYEQKDFNRAMKAYDQVIEWGDKNNPNYVFAIYYQAWCHIHMQNHKQATHLFNKVALYSNSHPDSKEAKLVADLAKKESADSLSTAAYTRPSSDGMDALLNDGNQTAENNLGSHQPRSGLTRSQVMEGMRKVADAVKRCGADKNGTFKIKVKIESDGHVSQAKAVGMFFGTVEGACAVNAVKKATFPRSHSSLNVTYPFRP